MVAIAAPPALIGRNVTAVQGDIARIYSGRENFDDGRTGDSAHRSGRQCRRLPTIQPKWGRL